MRLLFVDAGAGASGDMILGALVGLGLPVARLKRVLETLPLNDWSVRSRRVERHALVGRKVDVRVGGRQRKRAVMGQRPAGLDARPGAVLAAERDRYPLIVFLHGAGERGRRAACGSRSDRPRGSGRGPRQPPAQPVVARQALVEPRLLPRPFFHAPPAPLLLHRR